MNWDIDDIIYNWSWSFDFSIMSIEALKCNVNPFFIDLESTLTFSFMILNIIVSIISPLNMTSDHELFYSNVYYYPSNNLMFINNWIIIYNIHLKGVYQSSNPCIQRHSKTDFPFIARNFSDIIATCSFWPWNYFESYFCVVYKL